MFNIGRMDTRKELLDIFCRLSCKMNLVDKLITITFLLFLITNQLTVQGDTLESTKNALLQQILLPPINPVNDWNLVSTQAIANDYDPEITTTFDQRGATLMSRALAIIHGAIYEAMVVFNTRCYESVILAPDLPSVDDVPKEPTMTVAIVEAAYQTLYTLYPKQRTLFDAIRTAYLNKIQERSPPLSAINKGVTIGQAVARAVLKARDNDGSNATATYTPNNLPGYHVVDPSRPTQGYDGPHWGSVKPFIIDSVLPYRVSNIVGDNPSERLKFLNSSDYLQLYQEDKSIGARFSTIRTDAQTEIGKTWGYDGARKIGPVPRGLNQLVRAVVLKQKNTVEECAHLFALVNYASADARIAAWDSKYYYAFWRPIVAIRQGTSLTAADPQWLPLGANANGNGDNFTPPHPSYPSGHVSSSSCTFEILRRWYETDYISFDFQSDEYNGKQNDSITRTIRPAITRSYRSFTQAEYEVYDARIFNGVHWRIDVEQSLSLCRKIASFVYKKLEKKPKRRWQSL